MNVQKSITARENAIAARETRKPLRKLEIQVKDFSEAEEAVPIRLIYGKALVSGVAMTPVFNMRSVAITSQAGK